uniref:Phytocyanin domain-containing protein n=1 Tax=Setaria italica TaxID=4555 RepID=K3ZX58_SETIT
MPNALLARVAVLFAAGYTAAALAAATTTFVVGDDQGWTIGVDYIAWVKGKTFKAGDKLGECRSAAESAAAHALLARREKKNIAVFNYPSEEHTVTEVGKNDYFACAGGSALSNDRSGSTNVTLTGAGTRYFICNIPGHCTIGMRLAVTVAGGGSPEVVTTPTGGVATGGRVRPTMGSVVAAAAGALIKLALS